MCLTKKKKYAIILSSFVPDAELISKSEQGYKSVFSNFFHASFWLILSISALKILDWRQPIKNFRLEIGKIRSKIYAKKVTEQALRCPSFVPLLKKEGGNMTLMETFTLRLLIFTALPSIISVLKFLEKRFKKAHKRKNHKKK